MTPLRQPAFPPAAVPAPTLVAFGGDNAPALRARCGRSVALLFLALAAFAALQFRLPADYQGVFWGHDPAGAWHWRTHFGWAPNVTFDAPLYRPLFQFLLLAVWATYGAALRYGWRGGALPPRWAVGLVAAAALGLAVFCPPSLATDVYAYDAYGRLFAFYGQNPYVCPPRFLLNAHDPVRYFLFWDLTTVYGPLWTLLSAGVVAVGRGWGLWGQVVALKALAGGALLLCALSGRAVAERLSPGRGDLAFLAIGLNPLLLLEGPGNGHNDVLLVALLLSAAACQFRGRPLWAALMLGLSVGVKFVTLAALPWLVWECCRERVGRSRFALAVGMSLAALAPALLGYLCFWHGADTFSGLLTRSQFAQTATQAARDAQAAHTLTRLGLGRGPAGLLVGLGRQWPLLLGWAGLTLWLRRRPVGSWLTAWALFAPLVIVCTLGVPFPWYLAWVWPTALTRWDRPGRGILLTALLVSVACQGLYTCWRAVGNP